MSLKRHAKNKTKKVRSRTERSKANNESSMEKSRNIASESSDDVQTQVPNTHTHTPGTIPFTFQDGGKLNAEIGCTVKHVVSGYSDHSVTDSVTLFSVS